MDRPSTGAWRYRRNRAAVLAASDWCELCGHGGATTTDHIVQPKYWPIGPDGKYLPGLDEPDNLRPAHGVMGNGRIHNPCPVCGQLCNQRRGDRVLSPSPRSEDW
jgi:hypothetical protein